MDEKMTGRAERILVYAFRYALGRQTGAVADVSQTLIAVAASLPVDVRRQIQSEIDDAIRAGRAGAGMDVRMWQTVRDRLEVVE